MWLSKTLSLYQPWACQNNKVQTYFILLAGVVKLKYFHTTGSQGSWLNENDKLGWKVVEQGSPLLNQTTVDVIS